MASERKNFGVRGLVWITNFFPRIFSAGARPEPAIVNKMSTSEIAAAQNADLSRAHDEEVGVENGASNLKRKRASSLDGRPRHQWKFW